MLPARHGPADKNNPAHYQNSHSHDLLVDVCVRADFDLNHDSLKLFWAKSLLRALRPSIFPSCGSNAPERAGGVGWHPLDEATFTSPADPPPKAFAPQSFGSEPPNPGSCCRRVLAAPKELPKGDVGRKMPPGDAGGANGLGLRGWHTHLYICQTISSYIYIYKHIYMLLIYFPPNGHGPPSPLWRGVVVWWLSIANAL